MENHTLSANTRFSAGDKAPSSTTSPKCKEPQTAPLSSALLFMHLVLSICPSPQKTLKLTIADRRRWRYTDVKQKDDHLFKVQGFLIWLLYTRSSSSTSCMWLQAVLTRWLWTQVLARQQKVRLLWERCTLRWTCGAVHASIKPGSYK